MCEIDFDLEQIFMRRFQAGIFFLMPSDGFVMECRGHVYDFPKGTTERTGCKSYDGAEPADKPQPYL